MSELTEQDLLANLLTPDYRGVEFKKQCLARLTALYITRARVQWEKLRSTE